MGTPTNQDIVDTILEEHHAIRSLFTEFETAKADRRLELWQTIVRTLAVHETAEEEIVHPQVRRNVDGGDDIVDARLREEDEAKKVLATLEKIGPDDPDFESRFGSFRRDVLDHAEHEEQEELPQLRTSVDAEQRQNMAALFASAKAMAPTHPHKTAPESALGNLVVGPFVAIVDRVRDGIRDLMRARSS